ncbi:MAG: rod shape-determining protein MreD [Acidimicrobiales bacterium mtb01]|nr:rod shape-determining protein MreD [Actinomycetota bacterium]TEX44959.1 MAG: rod shape-determining protein MreD [Acidimicrobiales bacterium mtb01]
MIELINRPTVRLTLIGLLALVVQTTLLADLEFDGIALQIMLALSIGAGISGGSERGAMAGFIFGLMFDLVLSSPLGLTALVYGLVGFLAGYVNSLAVANPWWLNALIGLGGSAAATFTYPVVATWVGVDGWLTTRVIEVAAVVAVANALLVPVVVPVMRWGLVIKRRARLAPPPEIFA